MAFSQDSNNPPRPLGQLFQFYPQFTNGPGPILTPPPPQGQQQFGPNYFQCVLQPNPSPEVVTYHGVIGPPVLRFQFPQVGQQNRLHPIQPPPPLVLYSVEEPTHFLQQQNNLEEQRAEPPQELEEGSGSDGSGTFQNFDTYLVDKSTQTSGYMKVKRPKTYCRFCKNRKFPKEIYKSHRLTEEVSRVTCPYLLKTRCEVCQNMGHTGNYCPFGQRA